MVQGEKTNELRSRRSRAKLDRAAPQRQWAMGNGIACEPSTIAREDARRAGWRADSGSRSWGQSLRSLWWRDGDGGTLEDAVRSVEAPREVQCLASSCLLPEPNQTQGRGPGSVGSGLLWALVDPSAPRTVQRAKDRSRPRCLGAQDWPALAHDWVGWISSFQAEPGCPHLSPLGPFGRPISHEAPLACRPMFVHPLRCNCWFSTMINCEARESRDSALAVCTADHHEMQHGYTSISEPYCEDISWAIS